MTKSFEIRGKWWITPTQVIDCSADEHARIALAHMLHLPLEEARLEFGLKSIFNPFTEAQVRKHSRRGVALDVLHFLQTPERNGRVDPRVYVIKNWNWLRTRDCAFYAALWDLETCERFFRCAEFWKKHPNVNDSTYLEFITLSTGNKLGLTLEQFRDMLPVLKLRDLETECAERHVVDHS